MRNMKKIYIFTILLSLFFKSVEGLASKSRTKTKVDVIFAYSIPPKPRYLVIRLHKSPMFLFYVLFLLCGISKCEDVCSQEPYDNLPPVSKEYLQGFKIFVYDNLEGTTGVTQAPSCTRSFKECSKVVDPLFAAANYPASGKYKITAMKDLLWRNREKMFMLFLLKKGKEFRTLDPEEADAFWIPVVPEDVHDLDLLYQRLSALPYYQRNFGHDHFVINQAGSKRLLNYENSRKFLADERFANVSLMGIEWFVYGQEWCERAIMGGYDENVPVVTPNDIRIFYGQRKIYSFPKPGTFFMAESDDPSTHPWQNKEKSIAVAYAAGVKPIWGERDTFNGVKGRLECLNHFFPPKDVFIRKVLLDQCNSRPDDCHSISISLSKKNSINLDEKNSQKKSTSFPRLVHWYQESVFCLNPPGDDIFRSGIYESMIRGCIPVLFLSPSLENGYSLYEMVTRKKWKDIAVIFDLVAVKKGEIDVIETLKAIEPEKVELLRSNLLEVAPRIHYNFPHGNCSMFDGFDNSISIIKFCIEEKISEGMVPPKKI